MKGSDKAWLPLGARSLVAHADARLHPQVAGLILSANRDPELYQAELPGVPILADTLPGFLGPLAGVLAGLLWAKTQGHQALVSVAVDTPFFPPDLVLRLSQAGGLAIAASDSGLHPTFALWSVDLADALELYLSQGGRKLADFFTAQGAATVHFPSIGVDPFFNINTPDDLLAAEAWAQTLS